MAQVFSRLLVFQKQQGWLPLVLFGLFAICLLGYIVSREWPFLILPFGLLVVVWGMRDFRTMYLLMWSTIPFSVEIDLPGGLSTDLPAEPLMWASCILLAGYFYLYHQKLDFRFVFHPLFVLLILHFFWIVFTSVISEVPLISIKYTLAKSWYIICFVVIPLVLFRQVNDFRTWGLFVLIPLLVTIVIILIRHSQYGFTFETINNAVIPIYRNHVDYACALGISLPFLWFLRSWFTGSPGKIFWLFSITLIVIGIYFSYTRAAWLCIPVAAIIYFIVRLKWMRVLIPAALATVILFIGWLTYDNTYLQYAPHYEKTISHKKFDALVSATYRMEDISTVERFYRWVAGYYMVREKPVSGFGPSSFYSFYHQFADRHFITYVSDNPEQSGMHNYYFMVAVEQGLIGLAIFLVFIIAVLLYGEGLYHRVESGIKKQLVMAAIVSFGCNLFVLTLNDMVETDKLGSFFFLSVAILILFGMELHYKKRVGATSHVE